MSGGVRNLRAMFENKDVSTSPPDRGRSPAGSVGAGSNGTSPRPLSKVRTSFVTVERSGQLGNQLGLKRENSGEPSMAKRRTSFSIDEEEHPQVKAERKQSIATELDARKNSSVIEETIPEVAVETPSIELDKQLGGDTKPKNTTSGAMDLKKTATSNAASSGQTNGLDKPATTGKILDKPASNKFTARPESISTAKSSPVSKPSSKTIKSPAAPKTPTTPRGRPENRAKPPEKKAERIESRSAAASSTAKPTTKLTNDTLHGTSSRTRIPPSPPQTGFVKPKPRSPTRPVKLPASLTAHTASSGSKTSTTLPSTTAGRQSLSRASGDSQATNPTQTQPTLSRSPSRATAATVPKSTLKRKPSTLNKVHSRPSLGPPPSHLKKQPSRQSLPPSAPADDGFLARMMRPTTSSASKTAEKIVTPPKRVPSVKRPVSRSGPPKHDASKGAAPKMGKLVAKPGPKEIKPAAPSSTSIEAKEGAEQLAAVADEHIDLSSGLESPEMHAQVTEFGDSGATEHASSTEAHLDNVDETKPPENSVLSPVLENVLEIESTPEKPVPIEELLPVPAEPANESVSTSIKESFVAEAEEESSKKTDDVEVVKEFIGASKYEPNQASENAVEVEISKDIEAAEDPEDVKAREEIAKLNTEVMRASLDDDVE